jgi:ketosteroid isomerase-like protein
MRRRDLLTASAALSLASARAADAFNPETIIALERAALTRWGNGDPRGYLDLYAPDITYFDPARDARIDGLEATTALLAPLAGKIKTDRFEMLRAKVQHSGDIAVLSYNLTTNSKRPDGKPVTARWNVTSVYQRLSGSWKTIHNHFSFTKPELKDAG